MDGPWDIKRILGEVDVEEDGSAMFTIPANTAVFVQPLDAEGKALQVMRSWFTGMPGETVSCIGCHEEKSTIASPKDVYKRQVHTLSNFTTTNDAYVTPVPSDHLLKQGILTLTADLNKDQTDITIKKSDLFSMPMTLNTLQIDKELITYGTTEEPVSYTHLMDAGNPNPLYGEEKINNYRNNVDPELYPNVNWLDAVSKDMASNTRGDLTITGGSDILRYALVASYYGERDVYKRQPHR